MAPRSRPADLLRGAWLAVAPVFLLAAVSLAACERAPEPAPEPTPGPAPEVAPAPPALTLTRVTYADLPGWSEDRLSEALPALLSSCAKLGAGPDDRAVGPDALGGTIADWRAPCESLRAAAFGDEAQLRTAIENAFVPLRVDVSDGGEGTFTGYYEPELRGARRANATYRWPLYLVPDDLVTVDLERFSSELAGKSVVGRVETGRLVPYHDRAAIDEGVLEGRDLELIWLDDPVDAFFLHIQGSGKVLFEDGSVTRVGYAGSNGLKFYAIGRALIDEGKVPRNKASMQSIRDWLRANPGAGREVMQRNGRYIFFREITGDGPIGAQGVALTAGRSMAIDRSLLPLGAPFWLDTTWPGSDRPLRRLVVAQDVGSAIKGAVRGDLFWGAGEAALEQAGRMKQKGSYYLLLPKAVAERRDSTS